MKPCRKCHNQPAADALGICAHCLRESENPEFLMEQHAPARRRWGLPLRPPHRPNGLSCPLCANHCQLAPGEWGYCGMWRNLRGKLTCRAPAGSALAYYYLDPLPTNCCAAWFCRGSRLRGYNLAVFFYGCNFDCLFCQNASHKNFAEAGVVSEQELVEAALDSRVRCVCFFGGSPEPQLPFALRVARRIAEKTHFQKMICWEWNGAGNLGLVRQAARISARTGGTVKFDLKAFHPNIGLALCGVPTEAVRENFAHLAREFPQPDLLTATTLLVPFYVDEQEVEPLAAFLAEINPNIPYSLLVFSPDYYLRDLPITPREQVERCYQAARRHLKRVQVGNRHLLQYA